MKITKIFLVLMGCFYGGLFAQEYDAERDEIYDGKIDPLIQKMVYKKISYNKKIKVGYRIQIYNGDETTAREIFLTLRKTHYQKKFFLLYKEPNWKVQTEIYHDKLTAKKALQSIQKQFPNARIF